MPDHGSGGYYHVTETDWKWGNCYQRESQAYEARDKIQALLQQLHEEWESGE